ncbi:MAG: glycosyltransferase family 39 protein, partial [Anaerolineales bacterium]|nr:glycosyltransferase family 39 protein [Anaerolineales bacterium]
GVLFYTLATGFFILAYLRRDWIFDAVKQPVGFFGAFTVRLPAFIVSLIAAAGAFILFEGNLFTLINVSLWVISIGAFLVAFWDGSVSFAEWPARAADRIRRADIRLKVSPWMLGVLGAIALVAFFRLFQLAQVPPEMFSDHAEKLNDVGDVLKGQYSIFFPRNTGREAFQMYLTASMAILFNTGLSFMSLKLGTSLAGLATLPFIYLLGKEVGGRNVGLWALAFAGIAYWPNVISRVALRFTLYPFFAAIVLYLLVRGLRTANRNLLLLAGLALGVGLHGYSPFRFVPLVVVAIFVIYALHPQSKGNRREAFIGLILLALVSFLVFLPLFRYSLDEPEMFFYRTLSRVGSTESPIDGSPMAIFLQNSWNALTMFFWDNGETWVHSVTFRPALDYVSAALFWLGLLTVIFRYARQLHWIDLSLIISIPLLMMPSILSLAFPGENPSLNRTGGAIIPVFILVAMALNSFVKGMEFKVPSKSGRRAAWLIAGVLLVWSAFLNYDLVFRQYREQFEAGAWNSSEIGGVIRSFADSVGTPETAWVVPNAHWVDTRLVGINAGYPETDYGLWPDRLHETLDVPGPKMFIVRPTDTASVDLLGELYPDGQLSEYQARVEGKNFLIYFVPP